MSEQVLPVGKALRLLRLRAGFTQTRVAQRGGPDYRTISHWETGRKQPSLKLLGQYLAALESSFHDFQEALDYLGGRPDSLQSRLVAIEQRLDALEPPAEYVPGTVSWATAKETVAGKVRQSTRRRPDP